MENQLSQQESQEIAVLSFYSFVNIQEPDSLQAQILLLAKKKYVKGTVILAQEGFNGTISGSKAGVDLVLDKLKQLTNAADINIKYNFCQTQPFSKIKIKIKPEIVALKYGNLDIENLKGQYIEPKDWDEFTKQPDVVMVDTRNDYEVKIGTFKGAIDPKTETFRDLPEWTKHNLETLKDKKVAMYCTGGIRCEKSTALLKSMGVERVYHLKGGILQYLEDTKNTNQHWQGECFVFDDRGAVDEQLVPADGFWVTRGHTAKSISYSK